MFPLKLHPNQLGSQHCLCVMCSVDLNFQWFLLQTRFDISTSQGSVDLVVKFALPSCAPSLFPVPLLRLFIFLEVEKRCDTNTSEELFIVAERVISAVEVVATSRAVSATAGLAIVKEEFKSSH